MAWRCRTQAASPATDRHIDAILASSRWEPWWAPELVMGPLRSCLLVLAAGLKVVPDVGQN